MNSKVDAYLLNTKKWQKELTYLRSILINCGLTEELKWKQPCYSINSKNIGLIAQFKDYCVVSFFKGVLLNDADKLLVSPGENSQTVKYLKFTNLQEIIDLESTIKAYVFEAIEVEKAGLKATFSKSKNLEYPEELEQIFKDNNSLKTAFESLTPGRQRGYIIHFTQAKQSQTRVTRIEKCTPKILAGKGFNDCTCGHSKRMPTCDGSHKYL